MAILQKLKINDTGFLELPSGTTAERPPTPTVTATGLSGVITISSNGQQLYIPGIWEKYQNLPSYLKGLLTTTSINDSDAFSITFSHTVLVYLIRQTSWDAVDLTGWTTVESGKNYITNTTVSVYSRTFSAGTYTFDNNSAMYMFDFVTAGSTLNLGSIRFNTTLQEVEYFNGNIWITSYGRTEASAVSSAQQLFNLGVRTNGIYWIKPPGQSFAYRHYCDFSQGLGYMLVYKFTSGSPISPNGMWNGTGTNINYEANLNKQDGGAYASPYISSSWSTIAPNTARVEICDNGSIINFINFNSSGSNKSDWFTQARIQQSSFSEITGGTYNYFSIYGDIGNQRHWFINRSYGGCDVDFGYLCVKGGQTPVCVWDNDNWYNVLSDEMTPGRAVGYSTPSLNRHYNRRGSIQVYVR